MSGGNSKDSPYKVLLVEDNADDVELFMRALRKVETDLDMKINAHAIPDGTQAAAQLAVQKYDAIFLDFNMAPPDGMELTKRVRDSDINRTTPIVMITGAEDRGVMARAFKAGVNLFLAKPIDRMKLLRLMQATRMPLDRGKQ